MMGTLDSCGCLELERRALIFTLSVTDIFWIHYLWPPDLGGGRKLQNTL